MKPYTPGRPTAIFDLDGTLVKTSEEYIQLAVRSTLKEMGVNGVNDQDVMDYWFGTDRISIVEKRFGVPHGVFLPRILEVLGETLDTRREMTKVYDDVEPVLEYLNQKGICTGIVTGTPPVVGEMELALLGRQFEAVVYAREDQGLPWKPNPLALLHAASMLGADPMTTIYIGNADEDIIMAKTIGVTQVLVDRGEVECREKPTYAISNLNELEQML